jgi:hypothetical protein
MLKIYQASLANDLGQLYGTFEVIEVGDHQSIIKIGKPQSVKSLSVGDKVMIKAFERPAYN